MSNWPIGDGEMAGLIPACDWAATPLGPIADWPQNLKTIVDLVLSSTGMMSLIWGAAAIHLYNDGFAELLREHRTPSLGRSAYDTFARSRDVFADDLANGMTGQPRLVLEWIETGLEHAPGRTQPASQGGGYGRELIEQALPHALGARTGYVLTGMGLHCTIDLPSRPASKNGTTP